MDRLPAHPAFFQFFSPKREEGTLQQLRNDINWLRYLPQGGGDLTADHSDALDAAITRLCHACAASQTAPDAHLEWMTAFVSACDDLQVIPPPSPLPCITSLFSS